VGALDSRRAWSRHASNSKTRDSRNANSADRSHPERLSGSEAADGRDTGAAASGANTADRRRRRFLEFGPPGLSDEPAVHLFNRRAFVTFSPSGRLNL
jgi:hypothetical protein